MTRDLRPETAKPRPIYRGMDRAALDDAYNNTAAVADSAEWIARWTDASAQVRRNAAARVDIAYGMRARARLRAIVGEISHALPFLSERTSEFGFDPERLFVGGWSAGGHLTAAVSGHPAFKGGIPISGIFDLEPISLNYLNEKL